MTTALRLYVDLLFLLGVAGLFTATLLAVDAACDWLGRKAPK